MFGFKGMPSKYYIPSISKSETTEKTKDYTDMKQNISFVATKVRTGEFGLDK